MSAIRTSALAGILGFAALVAGPARADLFISVNANAGDNCALAAACSAGNTTPLNAAGVASGWTWSMGLDGNGILPDGQILSVDTLDAHGTGSLTLFATETNLNYGTAQDFLMDFRVTNQTDVYETRTFYIDTSNHGGTVTMLREFASGTDGNSFTELSKFISGLTNPFSITEVITLCSGTNSATCDDEAGKTGSLNAGDLVSGIPEPMSLSLLGSGLVALGAMSRRRRKAAKSA
ncbi:MAG TPA: PEP-CTERM sorting domain-containing protein [Rhizomicrobium sp.]|jgi:hypothetical protein|nr:PEP-CTERM sorting domain-containing protein [Rhizomicrobium sp.]